MTRRSLSFDAPRHFLDELRLYPSKICLPIMMRRNIAGTSAFVMCDTALEAGFVIPEQADLDDRNPGAWRAVFVPGGAGRAREAHAAACATLGADDIDAARFFAYPSRMDRERALGLTQPRAREAFWPAARTPGLATGPRLEMP
jgi:hypothetical protein